MTREASHVDDLLKDYLEDPLKRPSARATTPGAGPADPHPASDTAGPPTRDPRKEPSSEAKPAKLSGELESLLGAYLETTAQSHTPDFAVPRSSEVDDLLRRYVLDLEAVEDDLTASLRDHLEQRRAETAEVPAAPAAEALSETDADPTWRARTASRVRETVDLENRMQEYAAQVAEHEETTHAFSCADESTLKGVPPPNAPPIALGSPLARRLKKKTTGSNRKAG